MCMFIYFTYLFRNTVVCWHVRVTRDRSVRWVDRDSQERLVRLAAPVRKVSLGLRDRPDETDFKVR